MKVKEYFSAQRIVAIITLAYAIYYTTLVLGQEYNGLMIGSVGSILLGLCAVVIIIRKNPDVQLTAGLLGIGFGFQMIFTSIAYLLYDSGTNLAVLKFVISLIVMIAGMLCIMFSFPVYCGNKYDTKRIILALVIYLIVFVIFTIYYTVFYNENFFHVLTSFRPELLFFIPVIFYLIMLYKTNAGYESVTSRFNTNISIINDSLYSDHDTYVWRSDLKKLDELEYHMTPVNKGHVRSELTLPMTTGGKKANLVVQEWDNGKYYVMIMRHKKGTLIQTLRFEGVNTIPDTGDIDTCTSFTMYGNEGFFIRIMIKDEEIESRTSKRHKLACALVGVKNRY